MHSDARIYPCVLLSSTSWALMLCMSLLSPCISVPLCNSTSVDVVLVHLCVLLYYSMCNHSCDIYLPFHVHRFINTLCGLLLILDIMQFGGLEIHGNTETRTPMCVALLLHGSFNVLLYCHNNLTCATFWWAYDHVCYSVSECGACILQLLLLPNHCFHLHRVFCIPELLPS